MIQTCGPLSVSSAINTESLREAHKTTEHAIPSLACQLSILLFMLTIIRNYEFGAHKAYGRLRLRGAARTEKIRFSHIAFHIKKCLRI